MRGKKTSIELKAKVITAKINNPNKSSRDISSELEGAVSNDTVCDIINDDLPQVATESEIIAKIIENDMKSVKNMSEITERFTRELKTKDELDRADVTVANTTTESALKRAQLLGGKATERIDIGDYSTKTQKELEQIRSSLL